MIGFVKKIDPQLWMISHETVAVMKALNGASSEPQALFVGGCVRNTLLKRPVADIDIATRRTPQDVTEKLEGVGIKVVPTGIDHGTVSAFIGKKTFEITTLRCDLKTDGRHAEVFFTDDWSLDAARRDFTMNSLLADNEGRIYDPLGSGISDLEAGRVVFVGEPFARIQEDYLRILRFFRFYAFYGGGEPDPTALKACRQASDHIEGLSRERITQEFLKILASGKARSVLGLMFENNILSEIPNAKYKADSLLGISDVTARLVVLAGGQEGHMAVFERYMVLSNKQKKRFRMIIQARASLVNVREKDIKTLLYKYGADIAQQALLLSREESAFPLLETWKIPEFPLNGHDVMGAGIASGPQVGATLKVLEQWWIDQDFLPDREACLKKLKALKDLRPFCNRGQGH